MYIIQIMHGKRKKCFEHLQVKLMADIDCQNIVCGGDYCTTQNAPLARRSISGQEALINCISSYLHDFCSSIALLDAWRILHTQKQFYTWRRDNTQWRIVFA